MQRLKLKIGYVVLSQMEPVKTGNRWGHMSAKLYSRIGTAKVVASDRGGVVYEAFIEIDE